MSTIVTRAGKGSPLTNAEVDSNFTNLNTDKVESITSADGSVIVSGSGTTRDLSVGTAANTGTLISQIRNETGAALTKGTVVYISGASGNKALVSKALASGDTTSAQTYGMVQADIPNNQNGYVVVIGAVSGLDTSAFPDGTQLYLSGVTAGTYTSTKPYAPLHLVYVGIVTYSHANQGAIEVKIQNGYEMDELHDVSAQSPTDGQMLVYNSTTGLWTKSNAPTITGGTINNTTIGATTPSTGAFTEVAVTTATSETTLLQNTGITSWIYSGKSFSVAAQETAPTGLFIGSAGTKMYVNGSSGDDVNEYTLGTAWDITTATFVTVFSVAAQDTGPQDIFFKPDGLTMFVMGGTTDTVYQYTLGTAWDVSTASYASKSFSVTTQEATPTGLWFKPDGLVMYVVGSTADSVFQYSLSTAWDVSTASYGGIFYSIATQEGLVNQVNLSSDGLKMWVVGTSGDDIWEYNLGTAWNVSTATPNNNFYIGFQAVSPTGMFIDSSATNRVFITDSTADTVYGYKTEANSIKVDTEKAYVGGQLSVNGNFIAGSNAYVDGSLTVQSALTAGNITVGTTSVSGTLTSTSTTTLATSTAAQTVSLGAGATVSGSTKAINIGTSGVSGSTTTIAIGSNVSGSLGSIAIQSPTVNIGQTATQLSITNTASAVNYVQVTGAATGSPPAITVQGSDSNIRMNISSKGTESFDILTNNTGTRAGRFTHTASAVNWVQMTGAAAGVAPSYAVAGSDTNIDLNLTPKGTGVVKVGTNTVLHAGNYNTYAPTLTGTGASGSWGISVTGSAGSVAWSGVTGTPTTLSGYGITDAQATLVSGTSIKTVNGVSVLGSGNIQIDGGVTSFNTRTGAVTLSSGDVTTALGFTPYNATNPSGYITSSALSGYLTSASAASTYLPLSGGTVTGLVRINNQLRVGQNTNGTAYIDAYDGYAWFGRDSNSAGIRIDSSGNVHTTGTLNSVGALQQGGNQVLHAGNYNSYAPTLTGGGASGTWGINVTGSAGSATNALRIVFNDGPRDLTDRLPNSFTRTVNFDFVGAGTGNGSGNYAGVMTFSPWTGTTASTGDSSYQLSFANTTGVNASGQPKLSIRNGIDSIWNAWYVLLHSGNVGSYALPLSGGTVTGQVTGGLAAGSQVIDFAVNDNYASMRVIRNNSAGPNNRDGMYIGYQNSNSGLTRIFGGGAGSGGIQISGSGVNDVTIAGSVALNAGNYSSYALPLSGGTLTGVLYTNGASSAVATSDHRRIMHPGGATYVTQSSVITGAIKIKMPLLGSAMMMMATVRVYEYSTGKSFELVYGGHRDGNNWYNEFAYIVGDEGRGDITVRFGVDGSSDCVWIGETGTSWSYPQVWVTDVQIGYAGYSASWHTGWSVSFVTSFDTVNRTRTAYRRLTSGNYSSYALPISGGSLTGALSAVSGLRSYYSDHIAGDGYGIRFWESNAYKISMGASSLYQYGTVTDYSIKMQMDDGSPGRGFTWGRESYAPIASLNATSGNFQTAGQMYVQGAQIASGAFTVRAGGASGVGWGTGLNIGDGSNYTGFIQDAGTSRWRNYGTGGYDWFSSGGSQIMALSNAGYLGIGQASDPSYRLITSGSMYANAGGNIYAEGRHYSRHGTGTFYESLTTGNYTNYAVAAYNAQELSSEISASVGSDGWYTIATHGGSRGYAEFWVYDNDSSRHNFVHLGVVFSFGNGGITVLSSGRHGVSTIRHARLLYNTGNQTYGGAKLQIYCENAAWTIICRMGNDNKFSGWSEWSIITPVLENTPSGWAELNRVEAINDQGVIGGYRLRVGSTDATLSGNQVLHAGNYTNYSPGSGSSWTFGEVYSNGWFRNNNSNQGLYNQSTGGHFCSLASNAWQITGNGGGVELQFRANHNSTVRGYVYGDTGNNFGLLHSGGGWAVQVYSGGNGYLHGTWNGANIRANRANGNLYIDDNYGYGIVGTYASTRYQGVFAMGDSYKLPADGTTAGNLYGIAWSYPSAGGVAGNLDSHGMLVLINGGFGSCMSYSIKASSNVTAYSDERLKTNWRPMPEDYVARLAQVKVGIYDRIDGEKITQVGVGAQSFQELLPQAIETAKDEIGTLSVAYGNAALASAVELAKDNVELRARIERLESLINKLIGD